MNKTVKYNVSLLGPLASAQGVSTIAFLDKDGPYSPDDFGDYQLYFWEGAVGPAEYQFRLKPEVFNQSITS